MSDAQTSIALMKPIQKLPPLVIGGAVFNHQYLDDPSKLPIKEILLSAFEQGVLAIDTSPYYGDSEIYIGEALDAIRDEWPRDKYYLCTKAGRIKLEDFDYLRQWVRKSVERSLQRLKCSYLDLVYMHDVEFVEESDIFDALRELAALKQEGLILNFGISGYPIEFLLKIATACYKEHGQDIGPLDAVLSYCHGCLQNTKFFDIAEQFFKDAKIKKLLNGSILSMSLLRSGSTHAFHPAPQALKDAVDDAAQRLLKEHEIELADLATDYALKKTLFPRTRDHEAPPSDVSFSVVLGVSNLTELSGALGAYEAASNDPKIHPLCKTFQDLIGPAHLNETWASGKH